MAGRDGEPCPPAPCHGRSHRQRPSRRHRGTVRSTYRCRRPHQGSVHRDGQRWHRLSLDATSGPDQTTARRWSGHIAARHGRTSRRHPAVAYPSSRASRRLSYLPETPIPSRDRYVRTADVESADVTTMPVPAPLVARTIEVSDPGPLLALRPEHEALAWIRDSEGIVGWGVAARSDDAGATRFTDAASWWRCLTADAVIRDEVQLPGTGPVAFGSFAFADSPGTSTLVVPEVVVGHRAGRWWVTTVNPSGDLPAPPSITPSDPPRRPGPVTYADGSRDASGWESIVASTVHRISRGEVEKVVLARDMLVESTTPVDPRWPLRALADGYPRCWTFSVDGLIGAAPELLVRRERGLVTSRVLA